MKEKQMFKVTVTGLKELERELRELPKMAAAEGAKDIAERVGSIRCPVHGTTARVDVTPAGTTPGHFNFKLQASGACCEKLEALLKVEMGYEAQG